MKNPTRKLNNWNIPATLEEWAAHIPRATEDSTTSGTPSTGQPGDMVHLDVRFVRNPPKK